MSELIRWKRRRRTALLIAVLASAAVGLSACASAGLTEPAKLANGGVPLITWATKKAADTKKPQWLTNAKNDRSRLDIDAKNLSAQFGGAASFTEFYVARDYGVNIEVDAVRAQAPGYFEHYVDTVEMGETTAPREVQVFGDVTCDVFHESVTLEAKDNTTTLCLRTSKDLTIWVRPSGWAALPKEVASLTAAVWK